LNLAGLRSIKHDEVSVERTALDQEYLDKVKRKYVSTYHLLPQGEFDLGVRKLKISSEIKVTLISHSGEGH